MSEEGNTVDKKDYENEEHLHIIALQQLKLKLKDREYTSPETFERAQIYRGFRPNSSHMNLTSCLEQPVYPIKSHTEWRALITMFLEEEGDEYVDAYLRMSNHEGDVNDAYHSN